MIDFKKISEHRRSKEYRDTKKKILFVTFSVVSVLSLILLTFQYFSHDLLNSEQNTYSYISNNIINNNNRQLLNYPKDAFAPGIKGWVIFHIIGVIYMFLAIAIVCDEFFVPAIEVIVEKLNMSPDTAGATFMAAGGSAPELFTAFIGTFISQDDVGFGTIVGSAVFNVLFVIGCCAVFTSGDLALTWYPFARDAIYYCVTLIILAVFFGMATVNKIYWYESLILLGLYCGYVTLMFKNQKVYIKVMTWLGKEIPDVDKEEQKDTVGDLPNTTDAPEMTHRDRQGTISQLRPARPLTFNVSIFNLMTKDASIEDIAGIHMVSRMKGDVKDTFRQIDTDGNGTISLEEFAVVLKRLGRQVTNKEIQQCFNEIDTDSSGDISEKEFEAWYLRSSVRMKQDIQQIFVKFDYDDSGSIDVAELYELLKAVNGEPPNVTEVEDARKILDANNDGQISEEEFINWYENSTFFEQKRKRQNTLIDQADEEEKEDGVSLKFPENTAGRINYILTLPIIFPLYFTVPNVRLKKWENWWPWALTGSILWLGIYSFFMVWWATVFGRVCGIPPAVMGLTILAAGTSVPDLLTSIIVAKHGKADMAVSSSIGSNIFDVTVGLPLPWFVYAVVQYALGKSPHVKVGADSLFFSILVLFIMILAVLGFICYSNWRMTHKLGYAMFGLYIIFVIQDLMQQYKVYTINF